MTKTEFIEEVAKYVKIYAPKYDIAVYSPIIAQALKESAFGTSELARNANNYFGLKYKSSVAKEYYVKDATEQRKDGSTYTVEGTKWCKFKSLEECVEGYFKFISASRYANLKNVTDPKVYIDNIVADGYATSPTYALSITNDYIWGYNLTRFDNPKYYRVQTGAFRIKLNADRLKKKIEQADPKYKPFITKVNSLYKVQIGAFKVKGNAEKLVKELKSKGFDAIIV